MILEKMKMQSADILRQNIEKLAEIFPSCVSEGKVNFDSFRQLFSDEIIEGDEAYNFNWVGKKAALVEAHKPIRKTLRPCIEESRNWDTTENLYIEGDNLDVLKLLQESYLNKIKMIYIDPPYNTGNDFIYVDDYSITEEENKIQSGAVDEEGIKFISESFYKENNKANPRFHSDWCSMIYSRLLLARNLLADDGVIFISIDDNEQANLKNICDEVFGEKNFILQMPRITKKSGKSTEFFARNHDNLIIYSKTDQCKFFPLKHNDAGFKYRDEYFNERGFYKLNQTLDYDSLQYSTSLDYPITIEGITYYPGSSYENYQKRKAGIYNRADWAWRWSKDKFQFGYDNGFVIIKKSKNGSRIYTKTYQNASIDGDRGNYFINYKERTTSVSSLTFTENEFSNDNATKILNTIWDKKFFDYSKPLSLLKFLINISTNENDIVMTTAHAVMQLNAEDGGNRKFIMVQIPESTDEKSEAFKAGYKNICEIGKERIRRAGDKIKADNPLTTTDLDIGFRVLKVDSTNMQDVYYSADEYSQDMLADLESNIKADRTALDLLFGCILDWGLPLSLPYTSEVVDGCTIHNYNEGDLIACFDENIPKSVMEVIAKKKPLRAVFRDNSFAADEDRINVEEIFKLYAPDTRVKVI